MSDRDKRPGPVERDLRMDLFRGAGLWMVFLDHVPGLAVSSLTLRNYGFSDAAELFVFISGYLVGLVYAPVVSGRQFLATLKQLWKRAAQLYVAHILLFLFFTVQVARTARRFNNPNYTNEFNIQAFLRAPDILIEHALTLRYKPVNLDILPLFVVLILASPFIVRGLIRQPFLTMLGSAALYLLARSYDWNLPSYPDGKTWYFNPFCWQLLFVIGAWCGAGRLAKLSPLVWSRAGLAVAGAWLMFSFLIVMSWQWPALDAMLVPEWMAGALYPIDKSNLDMPRLTHFLATATLASFLVPRKLKALNSAWCYPLVLCGRHSLAIYCFSVLLSFSTHWILAQYGDGISRQLLVCSGGILLLVCVAWLLERASHIPDPSVEQPVSRR